MLKVSIEHNPDPIPRRTLSALTSDNASTPDGRRAKKGNSSINVSILRNGQQGFYVGRETHLYTFSVGIVVQKVDTV